MTVTSVTGLSGLGTVAGSQKGSEHMSLSVHKLVGPRIVAAGTETLSGTTGTIEIPAAGTSVSDHFVMLQTDSATAGYVSSALAASGEAWTFGVTAASGAVVNWVIVRKGL